MGFFFSLLVRIYILSLLIIIFQTITLFHPFKPQLGHKDVPKNVSNVSHEGKFYIEEKLDGDRMQMHYDAATKKFKWFTR